MPFLIIFILIPFIEISVFMAIGEQIGIWTTLLLALLTAIIGGAVIRRQGIATLMKAQRDLEQSRMPMKELFDGFCLIAAGALLITPGFVTDAIGFALLIPPLREKLRNTLKNHTNIYTNMGANQNHPRPTDPEIIEVEYEKIDD